MRALGFVVLRERIRGSVEDERCVMILVAPTSSPGCLSSSLRVMHGLMDGGVSAGDGGNARILCPLAVAAVAHGHVAISDRYAGGEMRQPERGTCVCANVLFSCARGSAHVSCHSFLLPSG